MPRLESMMVRTLLMAVLLPLGCGEEGVGDDLPPGAFTSGPEDSGPVDTGDDTTTEDPTTTVDPTTTTADVTDGSGGSSGDIPADLNHQDHIAPIWIERCGTDTACHDPDGPVFGLDLVSDGVYGRICSTTHGFSGLSYIDCEGADPQDSYIFRKIEGTHQDVAGGSGNGSTMPPDGSMTDEEIMLVETWISIGAPEFPP